MTAWLRRIATLIVLALAALLAPTGAVASAHPLGNFTVNHYDGLRLFADRVELRAVVDSAEIPTLQQRPATDIDADGTISPAEADRFATAECAQLVGSLRASVDGNPVAWETTASRISYPPGQPPFALTRLECDLVGAADLGGRATIEFTDGFLGDRIGWREITAVGESVRLSSSDVPTASVSEELRAYPADLLTNPLDVRSARLEVEPGTGGGLESVRLTTGLGWLDATMASVERTFNGLAGRAELTPVVGLLAVLLALLLGASHAALPGHGKTVIAAYLAGRQGSRRDAVLVGATVTLTHTAGVLVLGLAVSLLSTFAPEQALRWLGVISGLLVAAVGAGLLRSAERDRRALAALPVAERVQALVGGGHGHGHGHSHGQQGVRFSRGSLVGMGVAGGLVPSPTALIVLLGAIGLGRTWFGVVLVLCYGLGMSGTLTAAGLMLVSVRDRIARMERTRAWRDRAGQVMAVLPVATAVLVLVVGIGLALRSLAGP